MASILNFVIENFTHVLPILLSAGIGLIIMLERYIALAWTYPLPEFEAFFDRLRSLILNDRINEAIALCDNFREKPLARVAREGLIRAHQPQSLIEHGLHIAVSEATEKIQARTAFLATIANVSTLFGLLGTIMGLVQSFEAVGSATAQQRSALLAAGISTAMNATMLGLGVAIPCMIAYSYLMNRTNRLTGQIDQSAIRVLDLLEQRYYAIESGGPDGSKNVNVIRPKASAS
jgi:biopolymer transport protein ExbB